MGLVFEWHAEKSRMNLRKHGVSFREAMSVFGDPMSLTIQDSEHSWEEDRRIDLGMSSLSRLVVVAYTERGKWIRIISARLATRTERQIYEEEGI